MLAALLLAALACPLTDRLASPSYRQRAAAHRALRTLGPLALRTLERVGSAHRDPEVRARCHVLLRPYAEEIAEREAARMPCPPMWERFWAWDHDPWDRWRCEAADLLGVSSCDHAARRLATRLWVRSQLLQRRPRSEILAELRRMAAAE